MSKEKKIIIIFIILFLVLIFSELYPKFSFKILDSRAKSRVIAQILTVTSLGIIFFYLKFKKDPPK